MKWSRGSWVRIPPNVGKFFVGKFFDVEHVFCHCVRVRQAWQWIRHRIVTDLLVPHGVVNIPSDFELLHFCFISVLEKEVIWLVGNFVEIVWDCRTRSRGHLDVDQLRLKLRQRFRVNQSGQNDISQINL